MRLKLVSIEGYKRFAARSRLDTRGPMIAIVGPNEAGKTSLLNAIRHLTAGEAIPQSEMTDRRPRETNEAIFVGHYSLDAGDRAALGDLLSDDVDLTYERHVLASGQTQYSMAPWQVRNHAYRREARALLQEALSDGWLIKHGASDGEDEGPHAAPARGLIDQLEPNKEDLPATTIEALLELNEALEDGLDEEIRGHPDTPQTALANALGQASRYEREPPPHRQIHDILKDQVPQVLLFSQDDRALETEYLWGQMGAVPAALDNLFALAGVDFHEFRNAAMADDRAAMEDLEETANRNLEEAFKAWRQDDIHVAFSADKESLQLLVRDSASRRRNRLDERSDGLRSFVALIAFTARYAGSVPPVLLIDEAETHLHYAAQADLVRVFERQQVAQTIIYTTHSIGCLPSDLGAAIRVVSPTGDRNRSRIHNSFWAARGTAGLTPMMLAMGANALAFTPTRRAVIGEGPSEAILVPTLIHEALPEDEQDQPLGYQVAPGVSEIDPDQADELELEAGGVAYLIDADEGGRGHRRKIARRAKAEGRVVVLGDGTEEGLAIEDFVDATILAGAFNKLAARRDGAGEEPLAVEDLPAVGRAAFLDKRLRNCGSKLSKTALAQEALDLARDRGRLGDPARAHQLLELHRKLLAATDAIPPTSDT